MDVGEVVAIALAGLAAGAINTVVGSGTLITFPVLLAFGYSPVTANVSNTIGLVPGSVSGAVGYRRELEGQRRRILRLGTASLLGGTTGAVLLLVLPASAFKAIVPVFIAIALVLVVLQPRLNRMLAEREISRENEGGLWTPVGVYAAGVYGGYFGAAQGILLLGILGVALPQDLQRTNALKNVLDGDRQRRRRDLLRLRGPRGMGAGRDHRRRLDRRRPARRALRAPATPGRAARRDRGRRRDRDRAPARDLSHRPRTSRGSARSRRSACGRRARDAAPCPCRRSCRRPDRSPRGAR